MPWDKNIRKMAIEEWLKANKSPADARRQLRQRMQVAPNRVPSAQIISYWGRQNWNAKGVVDGNLKGVRKQKSRTARTDLATAMVLRTVNQRRQLRNRCSIPIVTACVRNEGLEISQSSVYKIMKSDLGLKKYTVRKTQFLKEADYEKRLNRCLDFVAWGLSDPGEIERIIFTDECNFALDGYVSNKNVYWWAMNKTEVPKEMRTRGKEVYSNKVMVWVAVNWEFGVSEPHFFVGSVNEAQYLDCIHNFFIPFLNQWNIDPLQMTLQQDGARCHTTANALQDLSNTFHDVIGNRGNANNNFSPSWPARSPDLSPNDYWLWGRLMQFVYPTNDPRPASVAALRMRITQACHSITLEECRKALSCWGPRLQRCIDSAGRTFEDDI